MGTVARSAVRSTDREGELGTCVKGVEVEDVGGVNPHAFRVSAPAPNPNNLIKSLRVILLIMKFSFHLHYYLLEDITEPETLCWTTHLFNVWLQIAISIAPSTITSEAGRR